jgi:hypothetical protein
MHWESARVSFKTARGVSIGTAGPLISSHEFISGVPSPGQEKFYLDLYVIASDKYPLQKDSEVVVEKFEYVP